MESSGFKKREIPIRTSSKRITLEEIQGQKRRLDAETDEMSKNVKLRSSFDSKFWLDLRDVENRKLESNRLQHRISMRSMEIDDKNSAAIKRWQATDEGESCLKQEAALIKKVESLSKQAEKIGNPTNSKEHSMRKIFTQLYIGAKSDMNLNNPLGNRPNRLQTQFRKELEAEMGTQSQETSDYWWCPVTHEYQEVTAGHLFPWKSGEQNMKAIFGDTEMEKVKRDPDKGTSELFRAVNGILWSRAAEKRFTDGCFCIVSDLDENATDAEVQAWQKSEVKEYRIRVLKKEADLMKKDKISPGQRIFWKDIDGRRLDFKGKTFRPRARYVYWSYIQIMLGEAYSGKSKQDPNLYMGVGRKEVGKKYWGSGGSYMRKGQLLGFVEEMGHEYEHLLEGAMDEEGGAGSDIPQETALLIANQAILDQNKSPEEREEEEAELTEDRDDGDD